MNILYIHNFRGFDNTYIPLTDVNFFVGENSTGKTSIISLLNILSEPLFTWSFDLSNKYVNLGNFNEVVSKGKKSFKIGFYSDSDNTEKDHNTYYDAIYMNFVNKENALILNEVNFVTKNIELRIIIHNNSILYKYINHNITTSIFDEISFESWISSCITRKKGYKEIEYYCSDKPSLLDVIRLINEDRFHDTTITKKPRFFPRFRTEDILDTTIWIEPVRAKPKSIYEGSFFNNGENDYAPYLLNTIFNSNANKDSHPHFIKLLKDFGKKSGLYDTIEVKKYNKDKYSPFEVNVMLDSKCLKLTNVGYGVSQVLPIIVRIITTKHSLMLIQQPEVHLHPKAQAAFGEFLYEYSNFEKKRFIIETHSDFLIDRFRICQNKSNNKINAQVVFFERIHENNIVSIIEIDENGNYPENQPIGFRDFFINEELELLGL